jgi:hypothetical protein
MEVVDIISELKTVYRDGVAYRALERHLGEKDVERWAAARRCTRTQLFDEIATCLAFGFHSSDLSFEFCDAVVNDLCGPVTSTSGPRPQVFWQVYSAFDEGEHYHGDNRDEDPVEVYTRPAIARIVDASGTFQRAIL